MYQNSFLDIILLILLLFLTNFALKFKNFLIDKPKYSNHKIESNEKIVLSGGLFFFLGILYFNYRYDLNPQIIYYFIPLIIVGYLSDINLVASPKIRFIAQFSILLSIVFFFKIEVANSRIIYLDHLLSISYFNIIFTTFCFLVLINGSNFIDGLNGLSCGYFLILVLSVLLLNTEYSIPLKGIELFKYFSFILGVFLIFNFFNKNYMGDNGIYFISALIGYYLIELSNLNIKQISPIYIVSLLWYPAFENLFSIIRRTYGRSIITGPDNFHLHALIYKRFKLKYNTLFSNNISSLIILFSCLPGFILSNIFHYQSFILGMIIFLNVFIYLNAYFFLNKSTYK